MPTFNLEPEVEYEENILGQRSYGVTYWCEAENRNIGPRVIRNAFYTATGINIGSPFKWYHSLHPYYEIDPGAVCTAIRLRHKPEGLGQAWSVMAQYEPFDPDRINPDDPTAVPILIRWGSATVERSIEIDLDNKPVVNSAGEPFMDPLAREIKLETLSVRRYEASYDPLVAGLYRGAVNDAAWTVRGRTFAARTVRCLEITADEQYHNDFGIFYVVDYEFLVDPAGWRAGILDRGLRMKVGANIVPIYRGGIPITVPCLLNGSGVPLPEPLPVGTPPVNLTFKVYPERDFTAFNFPV